MGTLSALVLGLLLSSAQTSFASRNQEVTRLSIDLIRMNRMLKRYGSESEPARAALRLYARAKTEDMFPDKKTSRVNLNNPQTMALFDEVENRILALKPANDSQEWLRSQALESTAQLATTRWALMEQKENSTPMPFLVALVFWLVLVFASFGLFAPRNLVAIVALFCCALTVSCAIELTLEMQHPFESIVRLQSTPMREALEQIER